MVMKIVELSHELLPGHEEYHLELENRPVDAFLPGYPKPADAWYIMSDIHMWSHVGTHIEAPYHYIKNGADVASLSLQRLAGPCVLVDFSDKKVGEGITREELAARGSDIQTNDIVFIRTLSGNYRTPQSHDRPYLEPQAVAWLVERGIGCLGVDCSGIERRGLPAQPNHEMLFSNGIPLIEHLAHLDQISVSRFFVIAVPVRVRGVEAWPVAVVALID
jgi:arylformamidase